MGGGNATSHALFAEGTDLMGLMQIYGQIGNHHTVPTAEQRWTEMLTMAEYIDRGALIEWLKRIRLIDLSDGRGLCRVIMEDDFKKAIKKMPKGIIADVAPVRHGRWLCVDTDTEQFFLCNRCKKKEYWESDYCPNCGCRMDG